MVAGWGVGFVVDAVVIYLLFFRLLRALML